LINRAFTQNYLQALAANEIIQDYQIHKWPDNLIILTSVVAYGAVVYSFYRFGILPSQSIGRIATHLSKNDFR